jgi:GntR family transcriptional regulator, rspAB operon transcriptional repressor
MTVTAAKDTPGTPPSRQAAAQVFERLREMIISLKLPPGAIINRQVLQSSFGLSSTPVRDALMRLGEEGLVDVVPQSATRVSLIDVTQARQAQFLRRAIEQEAVRILCAAPDKDFVPELRASMELQKSAAVRQDIAEFYALDRDFHRQIYEAAGAPDLYTLVRQRSGHIDRIRRLNLPVAGKMQQIIRDHGLIVKAIAAGDAAKAQAHVRDHLSRSLAYSPALRGKHPTYFCN